MESLSDRRVSFEQYQSWTDERRHEVIDGEPLVMAAPSLRHQLLVVSFTTAFRNALRGHKCKVLAAPCDVKLSKWDVVQPDLLVVCDPAQLQGTHVEGPPALVVEILSPSSWRHDRIRKLNFYRDFGIPEYWVVSPDEPWLEVLRLEGDGYRLGGVYSYQGRIVSPGIPALNLSLAELFEDVLPPLEDQVHEEPLAYTATGYPTAT